MASVKRFLKPIWHKIAITPIITILGFYLVLVNLPCPYEGPCDPKSPILEAIALVLMLPLLFEGNIMNIIWNGQYISQSLAVGIIIPLVISYNYLLACLIYHSYIKLSKRQNHLQKDIDNS